MAKKYYSGDPKHKYEYEAHTHQDRYKDYNRKAQPGPPGPLYSDAHSGMPEEVMMREYPVGSYNCGGNYDDSVQGIDMFAKMNHKKIEMQKRGLSDS